MTHSSHGIAPLGPSVAVNAISGTFLEAPPAAQEEMPPLTPFMIHIWRRHGLQSDALLERAADREKFVYWFYDTFHRLRAPYRWPVPPNVLHWLNRPVLETSTGYLTRFMLHVWKHFRQDMDVRQPDGYRRFLTWFALECIPAWNLPPALLPPDLLPALNAAVRDPLPMSRAMQHLGELHGVPKIRDAAGAPADLLLALSFEMLPELLRAGDPRLVPDFISSYWSAPISPAPGSPAAYEYLAARAWRPELGDSSGQDGVAAVHSWFTRQYLTVIPEADILGPPGQLPAGDFDCENLAPPDKVVYVYRDHHTIAGLSKAGLFTKEALLRTGLPLVDLDFSFGRDRMLEEHRSNARQIRHARSSLHILNLNPEYIPECLMCHLGGLDHARYLIGQFYWELSDIGSVHECGLSLVDEIWVATEYLRDVYRKHVRVPIRVMGQAVEPPPRKNLYPRAKLRLPADAFLFLVCFDAGSGVERKNPADAARAFRKAFPRGTERALLVVKTRNVAGLQADRERAHWRQVLDIAAGDSRIHVLDQTMTAAELTGLQSSCDCYVSLHRSEGFGYGPAEAMVLAKPVIVTDYSGVTDFCTPETALPVKYTLQRVPQGAYPYMDPWREYHWAAPDIADAALQMRRVYEDRELGRRLGQAGRALMLEQYSVAALEQRYVERLSELGWM